MFRLIFVGVVVLFIVVFFLQNLEHEVTLRYFFGFPEASTLIYVPIFSAFGLGLVVATILWLPPWVRGRMELRRKSKALLELQHDLERIRGSMDRVMSEHHGGRTSYQGTESPSDE